MWLPLASQLRDSNAVTRGFNKPHGVASDLSNQYQVYKELLVMNQNGVRPKKADMVSWLNRYWPRSGDATDALLVTLDAREKSVTKWMRWFRWFWHIYCGKLPIRSEMTPEMQGVKVCSSVQPCPQKWSQNVNHLWGLKTGPCLAKDSMGGPKTEPPRFNFWAP